MHSCMCIAISARRFQLCHHSWYTVGMAEVEYHSPQYGEHPHIPTHCPSLCPRGGMTVSREIVVFVESDIQVWGFGVIEQGGNPNVHTS